MEIKTYEDFKYEIVNNQEVSIVKYTGNAEELTIPDSIDGMPVTEINASLIGNTGLCNSLDLKKVIIPEGVKTITIYSFGYSKSLESVAIPASVTEIGYSEIVGSQSVILGSQSVFSGSQSLLSITVDENNPKYADVDGVLFNKDKTELIVFPPGKSYNKSNGDTIPDGHIETLDYSVPDGVRSIGSSAFRGSFLGSVTLPNSVMEIKSGAFSKCRYLKNITLPEGITTVERDVFENCVSLESLSIPETVTKIDHSAFKGCAALTNVTIPAGVTEIRFSAFQGCTRLTSINIPEGIKEIEGETFKDCVSLTGITIPAGATKINLSAFDGCESLEYITVDENNPVYASVNGALFSKDKNKMMYIPKALRLQRKSRIRSIDDFAGMSDEEIILEISNELGYDYEIEADDDWECAESMFEWMNRNFFGYHMKIHAFTEGDRITKLSFSGLDMQKLPLAVSGLSALKVLDIGHTKVAELPEWLGMLSALEVLNIYATDVPELPKSIVQLSALKELHLSHSDISELPEAIGQLINLEILHCNHTKISRLPESIGNLAALKSINLHGSKIEYLPESIGKLTQLEYLYAYYMPLKELPDSIGNLSALKILWICQTKVSKLPDSISSLTALIEFDYRYSKIKELPEALSSIIDRNYENYVANQDPEEDDDDNISLDLDIVIVNHDDADEENE